MIRPDVTANRRSELGARALVVSPERGHRPHVTGEAFIVNGAEVRLGQFVDPESGRPFIAAFDLDLTPDPKPALVLDGVRSSQPEAVLSPTRGTLDAGAKGVVCRRQVWQADDQVARCSLPRDAVHRQVAVAARSAQLPPS